MSRATSTPRKVDVVAVGPGHHAAALLERRVGDHRNPGHTHRPQAARAGAEQRADLLLRRRTELRRAQTVDQLLLHEIVVTAEQDEGRLTVHDVDQ